MTCYELRPYQEELVKGVQLAWRGGHHKPCIVLPCGGGKSVILAEIARRTTAKGGRVLFLVHRQELCEQIENTFINGGVDMSLCKIAMVQTVTRHLEDELPPKLIMTDECFPKGTLIDGVPIENIKVGDRVKSYNERTNKIEYRKVKTVYINPMPDTMLEITTNIGKAICTPNHPIYVLDKEGYVDARKIKQGQSVLYFPQHAKSKSSGREKNELFRIARVESIKVLKREDNRELFGMREQNLVYNLEVEHNHNYFANGMLVHNCHHSPSNTYKRIYEHFPEAYMLGATATPLRLDGTGMGTVFDELIVGVTVKELIAMHNLSPFRYYAPDTVDMSAVKKVRGDYSQSEAEAALDKPKIYGDVIEHYRHLADGRKAIAYCPTISYSEHLAERLRDAGIPAAHLDGNTPKDKRARIISAFRKGVIKILCNVDLISEGFDVPDCSCAILLRPTTSLVLYTQQSMRCMRYQPDKTAIIIDHVGNVERFGLPDTDRKWLLNPPKKERGKIATAAEKVVTVKQCPKCFYTYYSTELACPNCGYLKIETKNLFEDKKAVLKEYKEQMEKRDDELVAEYTDVSQCTTMRELYAYARKKGYKPGYAYIQGKKRGFFKK